MEIVKEVKDMDEWDLLEYILENPEYLTDSYYHKQFAEIHNQWDNLKCQNTITK